MKGNVYLKASDFPGLPLPRLLHTFPSECTSIGKYRYRAMYVCDAYNGRGDCSGGLNSRFTMPLSITKSNVTLGLTGLLRIF